MTGSRWRMPLGPPTLAVALITAVGALSAVAAGTRSATLTEVRPCEGQGRAPAAPVAPTAFADGAWFRLDPVLDDRGGLAAERLTAGIFGRPVAWALDTAAEAFAAGPFGPLVLVGSDDGRRSRLLGLDLELGCTTELVTEVDAVIRRATLGPDGRTLYMFRVDRRTRADLGVWAVPIGRPGGLERIVGPLRDDPRFGPTFSTELSWSIEGDRLVVESCGASACRIRVIHPRNGRLDTIELPQAGPVIGVVGRTLVLHGASPGLPAPILAIDLVSGASRTLADEAGLAVLVTDPAGPRVVHEGTGDPRTFHVVDPATGLTRTLDLGPWRILRLQPGPARARAGVELPTGWLAAAEGGRLRTTPFAGPAVFIRPSDGRLTTLREVLP